VTVTGLASGWQPQWSLVAVAPDPWLGSSRLVGGVVGCCVWVVGGVDVGGWGELGEAVGGDAHAPAAGVDESVVVAAEQDAVHGPAVNSSRGVWSLTELGRSVSEAEIAGPHAQALAAMQEKQRAKQRNRGPKPDGEDADAALEELGDATNPSKR
jgi:hypothetical protein